MPADPTAAPARDWNSADQRRVLPAQRRGRQPRRDLLGPRADPGRLAATSGDAVALSTGSSAAISGSTGWPSRSTTPSCRSPRRRTGGPRSAGGCATSSSASVGAGRDVAARDRRRPGDAPDAGRGGHPATPILAPWQAGRARSTPGGRIGSTSATGGRIVVVALRRPASPRRSRSSRRRPPMPTLRPRAPRADASRSRWPTSDAGRSLVIATDGELYGHHQPFRDLFLPRLVGPEPRGADRGFDVMPLARRPGARARHAARLPHPDRGAHVVELPPRRPRAGPGECPCAADGRWKAPLRVGPRAARRRDRRADRCGWRPGAARHAPDPWAARDEYVDVAGRRGERAGLRRGDGWGAAGSTAAVAILLDLMEAQRWRLAMFASDGWYLGRTQPGRRRREPCGRRPGQRDRSTDWRVRASNGGWWRTWPCSAHRAIGSTVPRSTGAPSPRSDSSHRYLPCARRPGVPAEGVRRAPERAHPGCVSDGVQRITHGWGVRAGDIRFTARGLRAGAGERIGGSVCCGRRAVAEPDRVDGAARVDGTVAAVDTARRGRSRKAP